MYWQFILLSLVALAGIGIIGFRKYKQTTVTQNIADINKSEKNIRKLITELQQKYFAGKMSQEQYNNAINQHNKELTKIKKMRVNLRNKRIKLLSSRNISKDMVAESVQIEEDIKKIQKQYYADKSITEKQYRSQFNSLHQRLAEIEDEKTTLEVLKKEQGNKLKQKSQEVALQKNQKSKILGKLFQAYDESIAYIKTLEGKAGQSKVKNKVKNISKTQTQKHKHAKPTLNIKEIKNKSSKWIRKVFYKLFPNKDNRGVMLIGDEIINILKKTTSNKNCKGKYIKLNFKDKNEK